MNTPIDEQQEDRPRKRERRASKPSVKDLLGKLPLDKLSLKEISFENFSVKQLSGHGKIIAAAAIALILVLILCLATCGRQDDAVDEVPQATAASDPLDSQVEATEYIPEETEPPVEVTMGTITTDQLNIRKDAGSDYGVVARYSKGDRVEILETKVVGDTTWGRTGKGWIGMGYVRMDGTPIPDTDDSANSTGIEIVSDQSNTVLGYGVVNLKSLNVRSGPGLNYAKISEVALGVRYAFYEASGEWVRTEKGWVSTDYFYIEGTTTEDAVTGTVTTNDLKVRNGPSTDFRINATYSEGDEIDILVQVNNWGYTENGWVSMMYVKLPEPVYTTGSATVVTGLNIRAEADPASEKVGAYKSGDQIIILEVQDGWGRTDQGWINLKYVKYD